MAIRVEKPAFNLREKLTELDSAEIPYDRMPKGSVLQVIQKYYTGHLTLGAVSTPTFLFQQSIYPKRKRSKFLINCILYYAYNGIDAQNADQHDIFLYLYRDDSPIGENTNLTRSYGQNPTDVHTAWYKTDVPMSTYNGPQHNFNYFCIHQSVNFLDDPQEYEVGEPIFYGPRIMAQNSFLLNRAKNGTTNGGVSSITISEIAS